ncbi:MAG: DUF4328 domain-containing protein [Bacteroidales bacterium]|jgi:hypothetical protein|nr:DUF4328 domain-containing protein [Bacteroidales bacterium]
MESLRPNEHRAKNAIIMIWVVMALEIVNIISSYMQYNLLQTIANGEFVSDAAAELNDVREQICGIVYMIAYLISGITFIMWFRRAYFNLHQKVNHLAYSDGWAAGSWFVPIINLYRPYKIMKEIYVETKGFLTAKGLSEKVNYSTNYLGWWWTLWIVSAFVGQFVFRFAHNSADTLDNLITTTVAQIVLEILGIPLALITVKIIKDYSKIEPLLIQINDREPEINSENEMELQ